MMFKIVFSTFILCLILGDSFLASSEPTWTTLRVTYGLNVFSSRAFAKIPRRESKARSEGYTKLSGSCRDGSFLGSRYIKGSDPAVVAIYDTNGYIAGIQNGVPKEDVANSNQSAYFQEIPAYQIGKVAGDDVYFLTAYFVDPSIICGTGRTKDMYEEQGTGTDLYLQNGTDPIQDSIHIPLYEEGMEHTNWVRGGCFPSMGVHYWYNITENLDCLKLFPFTVIYNRGKITSFAFANVGKYEFSSRFEHPPESTLSSFLPTPIPQCMKDEYEKSGGYSTMHVYFSLRPWNILC